VGILISLLLGFAVGWWILIIHHRSSQRQALQSSIAKWNGIIFENKADGGHTDCACCQAFMLQHQSLCQYCPIAEYVGAASCDGTPYTAWYLNRQTMGEPNRTRVVSDKQSLSLAIDELAFLHTVLDNLTNTPWWALNVDKA